MPYTAQCDDCGKPMERPLFLGQFNPTEFRTSEYGGALANRGYDEGDTITLCASCTIELLE